MLRRLTALVVLSMLGIVLVLRHHSFWAAALIALVVVAITGLVLVGIRRGWFVGD